MLQIEPTVLSALADAVKDAGSSRAITALRLAAVNPGSVAAREQRDALVAALRLHPVDLTKPRQGAPTASTSPLAPLPSQPTLTQLEIWSLYADGPVDPFLQGHLHHLLLDAGHGRTPDRVRGAAVGYLDAAQLLLADPEGDLGLPRAAGYLVKAGQLARKFKQRELAERAAKDAAVLAERLLDEGACEGSVLLRVLKELRALGHNIADLAERATGRFPSDVDARIGFLDLMREEASADRRTEIDTAVVQTLLDAADADEGGHRRLAFRHQAAAEAGRRGLPKMRARAEMALQQTPWEGTRIRTEVTVPHELLAEPLAWIDAAPDLRTALWRTSEDIHPFMGVLEQLEADGAFDGLLRIPTSRINPAGPVPVRLPAVEDFSVREQASLLAFSGIIAAAQLDRIGERFQPDEHAMTTALAHETVLPQSRAALLAQAFHCYWSGQLYLAACAALPQLEQLLRELLRTQRPILSVPVGQTPGGLDTLGPLLKRMQEANYPEDWRKALELVLVDQDHGLNLRNNLLHGLTGTPPKNHVALILQAALYLLSHSHGHRTIAPPAPRAHQATSD